MSNGIIVYENALRSYDLLLLELLRKLCLLKPRLASKQFGLSSRAVKSMASASDEDLRQFSSGTLLSFKLISPESEILARLQMPDAAKHWRLSNDGQQLEVTYWSHLANCADKNVTQAALTFGVSEKLAAALSDATPSHFNYLAAKDQASLALRFDGELIVKMHNSPFIKDAYRFQKVAQCLTASRRML